MFVKFVHSIWRTNCIHWRVKNDLFGKHIEVLFAFESVKNIIISTPVEHSEQCDWMVHLQKIKNNKYQFLRSDCKNHTSSTYTGTLCLFVSNSYKTACTHTFIPAQMGCLIRCNEISFNPFAISLNTTLIYIKIHFDRANPRSTERQTVPVQRFVAILSFSSQSL